MSDPLEIAKHLLEVTQRAVSLGEEDTFLRSFLVPHKVETGIGNTIITNYAEMAQTFGRLRAHWDRLRIDQLERTCLTAMYVNTDTIVHVHKTRILRDNVEVEPSHKTLSTLNRVDGEWFVAGACYALQGSPAYSRAILGQAPLSPLETLRALTH